MAGRAAGVLSHLAFPGTRARIRKSPLGMKVLRRSASRAPREARAHKKSLRTTGHRPVWRVQSEWLRKRWLQLIRLRTQLRPGWRQRWVLLAHTLGLRNVIVIPYEQ